MNSYARRLARLEAMTAEPRLVLAWANSAADAAVMLAAPDRPVGLVVVRWQEAGEGGAAQ